MEVFELDKNKPKRLAEVERDAVRIQTKRFNEQFEDMEYKAQLKAEAQVEAEAKKGKVK